MLKIFIADDSALARAFMIRCINISGISECEFFEASNGLEVIEKLREVIPDLLITDINMPKCNGIDLVKRIKANPKLSKIPVMVMSSAGNAEEREELNDLGVNLILSKPFTPPEVINIANSLLGDNDSEGEW
jgi:CheY-like chemotaxis protein